MLQPLQEHHVQEQIESGSHEHLWEQWTLLPHSVTAGRHQNLQHHTQYPKLLVYNYQKQHQEQSTQQTKSLLLQKKTNPEANSS